MTPRYIVIRIIRKRFDKKIMPYSKVNNISNIGKKRRGAYRDAQRVLVNRDFVMVEREGVNDSFLIWILISV